MNIQGMNPGIPNQKWKIPALSEEIQEKEEYIPFVVAVESHLSTDVLDAEIQIQNYNIYRSDRVERKQGGVIIYSYKDIIIDDSAKYSDDQCSSVMIYSKSLNLIIAATYRPPLSQESSFMKCNEELNTFIRKHENADIFIMGDYNFRFVQWHSEHITSDGIPAPERRQAEMLIHLMNEHLLTQTVTEYTRAGKSILDLVIVNNEDLIHSIQVNKTNFSDHDELKVNILHKDMHKRTDQPKEETEEDTLDNLYMLKADWEKIRTELQSVNWDDELNYEDIEEVYKHFEEKVTNVCAKYTPKRQRQKPRQKIPKSRLALIRKKKNVSAKINLYKYVKSNIKPDQREKNIERLVKKKLEIEEEIKKSLKNEQLQKEIEALKHIKTNPKAFFTYTKKFSKVATSVGPLKDEEGNIHVGAKKKANILQNQFKKVFSDPSKASTENIKMSDLISESIEDIDFSVEDVEEAIKSIPTFSAPGPDKFPAIILKECAKQLSYPLMKIWRKSLDDGKIPSKLKYQTIIPIFKKGSKGLPANYRPVSLTSHVIKMFERVMRKKIVKFIEDNELLIRTQYGFREGRSPITQLLKHIDNIISILEEDANADVVYLDFAKAFDKVDHNILLHKLNHIGIRGKIHKWIKEFITGRSQEVIVDREKSQTVKVISGVPQGTVLGPILFIIFINDLEIALKYSLLLVFADDSKFTKKIRSDEDHEELQTDIHAAIIWSLTNNMQLNMDKFQLVQHGVKKELQTSYQINADTTLERSEEVKDLGIYISESLEWDYQFTYMINASKKITNWILRTFISRNTEIMMYLFKTFVIPKLEYGSQVWSPYKIKDINRIEAVQRTITSKLDGLENFNYHERLQCLHLYSLQRRRERFIIITMWKMSVELLPNNLDIEFYETRRFGIKARRKLSKATRPHLRTVRFNFFTSTGPALFNLVPKRVKEKETLATFKKHLDIFLHGFPDCPPCPGYKCANNNSLIEWAQSGGQLLVEGRSLQNTQPTATQDDDDDDGEADDDLAINNNN